jgi:hypothetical protein
MKMTITTLILALTLSPVFAQSDSIPNHPGIEPSMTQSTGQTPSGTLCGFWTYGGYGGLQERSPCAESPLSITSQGWGPIFNCSNGYRIVQFVDYNGYVLFSCAKL